MSGVGPAPQEDWPIADVQGQHLSAPRQHALLTSDFKASGIDPSRFGFYDQPAFLARELANPTYRARYAEWVATRPLTSGYEQHVRATVPRLAHLLATTFAAHDARCRCLAATAMMTRMLDCLGVWSFGLLGSVIIEAPARGLRRAIHTIDFKSGPRGVAGHAWVVAPPFLIVDPSLALQRWEPVVGPLIPDVVLANSLAPVVQPRVEDCISERVREMFAQAEGWHDPALHYRLDLRLQEFLRTFPALDVVMPDMRMRFVPVTIEQSCETLARIKLHREGPSGRTIWNSIVAPAFAMPPLP